MEDKTLTCRDCNNEFLFTVGEQQFYAERGFQNEPSRCPECRQQRRGSRGGAGGERQMYPVTCSACGKDAEVPFQPRGDRPVYCSDCFEQQGPRGGGGGGRRY